MPNKKTAIKTNSTQGSIKETPLKVVTFDDLWSAFPSNKPCLDPLANDQCAARISVALKGVGVEGKSFHGKRCSIPVDKPGHMLRAHEVAEWLKRRPFPGCPKEQEVTGANWQETIKGKKGIIFFNGYWHRKTDGPGVTTGNHMDLWDGHRLTISGFFDAFVTAGRYIGIRSMHISDEYSYSDLGKSHRILFWEIK